MSLFPNQEFRWWYPRLCWNNNRHPCDSIFVRGKVNYPPVSSNMACWKIFHLLRWYSQPCLMKPEGIGYIWTHHIFFHQSWTHKVGPKTMAKSVNITLITWFMILTTSYNFKYTLVGGWATPLKNMSPSIGMMKFPIYGKIKLMFQTTNQYCINGIYKATFTSCHWKKAYKLPRIFLRPS